MENRIKISGSLALLIVSLLSVSCQMTKSKDETVDPYLWLEQSDTRSLQWVEQQNRKTLLKIQSDKRYASIFKLVKEAYKTNSDFPFPVPIQNFNYHFLVSPDHPRGIWRRASQRSFDRGYPQWELILDLDLLSKEEGKHWKWTGADCLHPEYEKCLIQLSEDGQETFVIREYNLKEKKFVSDGFQIPQGKTFAVWKNSDQLLVSGDFGEGTLNSLGEPLEVRLWERGTPISQAKTIYRADKSSLRVWVSRMTLHDQTRILIGDVPKFHKVTIFFFENDQLKEFFIPKDAALLQIFGPKALILLRHDWNVDSITYPAGSVISLDLQESLDRKSPRGHELLYRPSEKGFVGSATSLKNFLLINVSENVHQKILKAYLKNSKWILEEAGLPSDLEVEIVAAQPFGNKAYVTTESFLSPLTLHRWDVESSNSKLNLIKTQKTSFNGKNFEVDQAWAQSLDGTSVPYFLIHKKGFKRNGKNPTLLYGYGGFEVSLTPTFVGMLGKVWLDRGGVYVVANIRGGKEFGPQWHQSAVRENKQKSFDDFISVAEDLVAKKITRSEKLGVMGASGGGLLVTAAMAQRPELFKAVIASVPLIDMLRYTELGEGRWWTEEYGDPKVQKDWEVIKKYSPYYNVNLSQKYPALLLMTSKTDERVGPGHARKMAAKMLSMNHDVTFYETATGGHGGGDLPDSQAIWWSLTYTYLLQQLMPLP